MHSFGHDRNEISRVERTFRPHVRIQNGNVWGRYVFGATNCHSLILPSANVDLMNICWARLHVMYFKSTSSTDFGPKNTTVTVVSRRPRGGRSTRKRSPLTTFFVNGHARSVRGMGPEHTMHRFRRYTLFAAVGRHIVSCRNTYGCGVERSGCINRARGARGVLERRFCCYCSRLVRKKSEI